MTLEQARAKLTAATTEQDRKDWAQVVAIKESRVAREGGNGEGDRVKGDGIPIGENPYDTPFAGRGA